MSPDVPISIRDRLKQAQEKLRTRDPKDVVVTFGKFVKAAGRPLTIDEIAQTDEGLLWLDWAIDSTGPGPIQEAMSKYMSRKSLVRDLEKAMAGHSEGEYR